MVAQPTKNEPSLAEAIEKARVDYVTRSAAKRRLPREFLDGVVKGFGMAVGGTIVFGIVLYFLGRFLVIPDAQEWLNSIQQGSAMFNR
ncbi:MAG: DUF5665 domain-containing protein [Patescibacteria group bacterium]